MKSGWELLGWVFRPEGSPQSVWMTFSLAHPMNYWDGCLDLRAVYGLRRWSVVQRIPWTLGIGAQIRGQSTVCVDDPWSSTPHELLGWMFRSKGGPRSAWITHGPAHPMNCWDGCSGPRVVRVDDPQSGASHVAGATAAECVGQS